MEHFVLQLQHTQKKDFVGVAQQEPLNAQTE